MASSLTTIFPRKDLDQKFEDMNEARDKLTIYFGGVDRSNINKLNETATAAQAALFDHDCALLKGQVEVNAAQIAAYRDQLKKLENPESAAIATPSAVGLVGDYGLPDAACLIRTLPRTPRSRWRIRASRPLSIA